MNDRSNPLDLTYDDLFYGYSLPLAMSGDYGPSFWVRECQMCGALVNDTDLHLNFHRNSPAPEGFEPGDHNPNSDLATLGKWTERSVGGDG
jgi:hypothetical protein